MQRKEEQGFTIIELLIVITIIAILATIAIPGFLGMQERGKKGSVIRGMTAAIPDIQAWILAAKDGRNIIWIDTTGDGMITAADDSNAVLAADYANANQLCTAFVSIQTTLMSPWNSATNLWLDGAPAPGRISCQHPASGSITIVAQDGTGAELLRKIVAAD